MISDKNTLDFNYKEIMSYTDVVKAIESFGLELSSETGGRHFDEYARVRFDSKSLHHKLNYVTGEEIRFFDVSVFIKSLKETEKSLKLKLFHD